MKLDLMRRFASRYRQRRPFEPPPTKAARFELPQLPPTWRQVGQKNFLVLGNCQARAFATTLQALCSGATFTAAELPSGSIERVAGDRRVLRTLNEYDGILVQNTTGILKRFPTLAGNVIRMPIIGFAAYHPDLVYINTAGDDSTDYMYGPMGQYNSAIALWAYLRGMSPLETLSLFNADSYAALGYFDFWQASRHGVLHEGEAAGMMLHEQIDRWASRGCFMHSVNHPKIHVFSDLAQRLLQQMQLPFAPEAAQYAPDAFADGPVWPVYPEVGQRLGIDGDYRFKIERGRVPPGRSVVLLDLREFIEGSFAAFGSYDREQLRCERLETGRFEALAASSRERAIPSGASTTPTSKGRPTPYSDLPRHQF